MYKIFQDIPNHIIIDQSSSTSLKWKTKGRAFGKMKDAGSAVGGTLNFQGESYKIVDVVYFLLKGVMPDENTVILQKQRMVYDPDSLIFTTKAEFEQSGLSPKKYVKYVDSGLSLEQFKSEYFEQERIIRNLKAADKYKKNKSKVKVTDKSANRARLLMLRRAKQRAMTKGLPFNLEIDDIVIPENCPVFGFPLKTDNSKVRKDSASLDRVVPELGYVKGNIMVVSALANTMKTNATEEELVIFAQWVLNTFRIVSQP